MAKKSDLLLWGGTAVVLGIVAVGTYLVFANPPGAPQISLNVIPNEVQQGQPVIASGNITVNGQASSQRVYLRVREPSGGYNPVLIEMFGPAFSQPINTSGKPPGDYVVECSDRLDFI